MGDTPLPPPLGGDAPPPPPPPPPSASVVGYGKRTEALPGAGMRAPASILHSQPGAQPLLQIHMQNVSAMPGAYSPLRRYPFQRNVVLTIAQLLAVAQGILGLINGINGFRLSLDIGTAFGRFGAPSLAGRVQADMLGVILISLLVMACAAAATRPSNVCRWLVVGWEAIVFVITLVFLVQIQLLSGVPDVAIIAILAAGLGFVHPLIALTMSGIIIFGFALYPPTWRAYHGASSPG